MPKKQLSDYWRNTGSTLYAAKVGLFNIRKYHIKTFQHLCHSLNIPLNICITIKIKTIKKDGAILSQDEADKQG